MNPSGIASANQRIATPKEVRALMAKGKALFRKTRGVRVPAYAPLRRGKPSVRRTTARQR